MTVGKEEGRKAGVLLADIAIFTISIQSESGSSTAMGIAVAAPANGVGAGGDICTRRVRDSRQCWRRRSEAKATKLPKAPWASHSFSEGCR